MIHSITWSARASNTAGIAKVESPGGLEIDSKFEFGCLKNRLFSRLFTDEYAIGVLIAAALTVACLSLMKNTDIPLGALGQRSRFH